MCIVPTESGWNRLIAPYGLPAILLRNWVFGVRIRTSMNAELQKTCKSTRLSANE